MSVPGTSFLFLMRVLFLTHRLPYAPNRGDRIRAYHLLRVLRRRADVHLLSFVHDSDESDRAASVSDLATAVSVVSVPKAWTLLNAAAHLPTSRPLTHCLLDSPRMSAEIRRIVDQHRPEVVLAYCSGMARFTVEPPLDGIPFVLDMVDVDSLKWEALVPVTKQPLKMVYAREARRLRQFERLVTERAHRTLVVNDKERDALLRISPAANVSTLPSGVDFNHLKPTGPPAESKSVVFCGVMNYGPNEEAAQWLVHHVWPEVVAKVPSATLTLVGSNPSARVLALSGGSVRVTGAVPDVRPYLWDSAVAVAPLRIARGIQNKVLEAVAAGLPVVTTSVVSEGLPPEVLPACYVADDAAAFARAVVQLLDHQPAMRRSIANRAQLQQLSWDVRVGSIYRILEEASRNPFAPRAEPARTPNG